MLVTGAQLCSYLLSFASILILARLLVPSEFGTVALAVAIADFLMVGASFSLPAAILREPDETAEETFNSAMYVTAATSAVVLLAAAPVGFLLSSLESGQLAAVFAAIIGGRGFAVLGYCYLAEVERRLAYGRFSVTQIGSQLLALVVAVGLGVAGAGVWALAARDIVLSVAGFFLSMAFSRWRPRKGFDGKKARELVRFGIQMAASRFGDMLFHRYDNLVVGAIAGLRQLGLYNQAYVIAEVGNRVFAPVLAYLPLNLYAKLQRSPQQTERVYELLMFWLVRAVVPIGLVFVIVPAELLTFLFGARWAPAADMLRGLSAYAMLLPLFEHARVLLVANGAVASVLRARAVQLAVFLPAVPVLVLLWGGPGAAMAVAAAMVAGTATIIGAARRWAVYPYSGYVPPLLGATVAAGAAVFILQFIDAHTTRLLVGLTTVLGMYVGSLVAIERSRLRDNLRVLVESLRQRPQTELASEVPN